MQERKYSLKVEMFVVVALMLGVSEPDSVNVLVTEISVGDGVSILVSADMRTVGKVSAETKRRRVPFSFS